MARPEVLVALQEGALEGDALGEPSPSRQLGGAAAVEIRGSRQETGVFPGLVVEGDVFQGLVDAGREGADGVRTSQSRFRRGIDGISHLDQGPGAEGLLGVEEEADGHDPRPQARRLLLGFEHDAGGARLQGLEGGLAVALAFGEEGDGSPLGQDLVGAGKGLGVLGGVGTLVLPAVDGDGLGELQEGTDGRDLPEAVLGQEPRHDGKRPQEQQRIDQPVDMVGDEDERPVPGDALGPHDLDFAEEDLEDEADEGAEEAVGGCQRRAPARA